MLEFQKKDVMLVGSAANDHSDPSSSFLTIPALVQPLNLFGLVKGAQLFVISNHSHPCLGRSWLVSWPSDLPPSVVLTAGSTLKSPGAFVTKPSAWASSPQSLM